MNTLPPPMALALCASFGSVEAWQASFVALAQAHAQGGLELAFSPQDGLLVNRWVGSGSEPRGVPILSLRLPADVHAFVGAIVWPEPYQRYQEAVHAAGEAFGVSQGDVSGMRLIDVRRAGVFDTSPTLLPGAVWRDPARVREWAHELLADRAVLVYCVYGHEVGRATALRLRALGVNARFLNGGIDGWQRAGLPTVHKPVLP